ncbi:MAG: hypothetical protein M1818_000098 [Claussenomyces sp. TS43310]|nr:MAG: hypothetical protein M1818_000098 [Claussenomyces sp. TS43310]
MAENAYLLEVRDWENETHIFGNGTSSNATQALIASLQFTQSKSIRTSIIVLASFNVLAACATVFNIVYDWYWSSKRRNIPKIRTQNTFTPNLHAANTMPVVLAIGIIIQGCMFAGAQTVGLRELFANDCKMVAQVVFPALFLVPYILVVFGTECSLKSLTEPPFGARRKYDVTICLGIIALMVLGTWLPTHISPQSGHCFASLMWFMTDFGLLGLSLLALSLGLSLVNALIVSYRLLTVTCIDKDQRIAASRMVCYLILSVVSLGFVIPWFITVTIDLPSLITSMIATVVVNLSGIMLCALQLLLSANTTSIAFTRDSKNWGKEQNHTRIWGSDELGFGRHVMQPVSGPRPERSMSSLVMMEKRPFSDLETLGKSQNITSASRTRTLKGAAPAVASLPKSTGTVPSASLPCSRHQRKLSYSLFPAGAQITSSVKTQALRSNTSDIHQTVEAGASNAMLEQTFSLQDIKSIYTSNKLEPPPRLDSIIGPGRQRSRTYSTDSSATVQIGLRVSYSPAYAAPSHLNTALAQRLSTPPSRHAPTTVEQKVQPAQPEDGRVRHRFNDQTVAGPDTRMKALPAVPQQTRTSGHEPSNPGTIMELSSTVYRPERPKMKGQGSSPRPTALAGLILASRTRSQPLRDGHLTRPARASKADWI